MQFFPISSPLHCVNPPPPPICWGLNLVPNFQKEGAWQEINFLRGIAGKRRGGGWLFQGGGGGCNFYIINKLKYEIFNDKQVYK